MRCAYTAAKEARHDARLYRLPRPRGSLRDRILRALRRYWPLYLMAIPGMLYFIIYKIVPIFGAVIAFKNFTIKKGIWGSPWAQPWYQHYKYFFRSPSNVRIITNTITLSLGKLVVGLLPPLIFALAISECRNKYVARAIQTVSYLPHFLSWAVVYGICLTMLSESTGVINGLIKSFGGKTIPFLTSNKYFRGVLIGSDLWKNLGWGAITYIAAIMGVDTTLYEAATVDGCGRLRQIIHVTLPGIRKIFVVLMIMNVGKILNVSFTQVNVMMNDSVRQSGEIIDTWIYTEGLGKLNYSLSTAVGLLKSVISFMLVFATNRLARKWECAIW